jgi:hypothetical protein
LRHRKALDLLIENARVSEEEWREDAPPAAVAAADDDATGQANENDEGGETQSGEAQGS